MLEQRILVAVTDTEAGRNAARQAVQLASSTSSRLTAVSVMPGLEGDVDRLHVSDIRTSMAAPHEKALEEVKTIARQFGLEVRTSMPEGLPHEQLVDQAEAMDADLLILGESRRSAIERTLLSPTASRVIGYCRRDVMVIPEGSELGFKTVLVALDGSKNSHSAARKAMEIAKQYGSKIVAVFVIQMLPEYNLWEHYLDTMSAKAKGALNDFAKEAESLGLQAETHVDQNPETAQGVLDRAETEGADLLVMGSHGRTGLKRLLMGSVAESVLAFAKRPVLIVH